MRLNVDDDKYVYSVYFRLALGFGRTSVMVLTLIQNKQTHVLLCPAFIIAPSVAELSTLPCSVPLL